MIDDPARREKRIIRLIIVCSAVWVVLTVAAMRIVDVMMESSPAGWRIGAQAATVVVSLCGLFWGQEPFVRFLLRSATVVPKADRDMAGHWAIHIMYINERDGRQVDRHGTVMLYQTAAGLRLQGSKLLDAATNDVVVESWVSESAEVIHDVRGATLLYSYRIRRPDNPAAFDKVGYVVASSFNEDRASRTFRGDFVDLALAPNAPDETLRRGKVLIFKSHK
jgi:hypothetical protein